MISNLINFKNRLFLLVLLIGLSIFLVPSNLTLVQADSNNDPNVSNTQSVDSKNVQSKSTETGSENDEIKESKQGEIKKQKGNQVQDDRFQEPNKGINTDNLVHFKETKAGVDIEYLIRYSLSSNYLTSVKLTDIFEQPFKIEKYRILNENLQDISDDGAFELNGNKLTWTPTNPNRYSYATVYLKVIVTIPKNADLTKYKNASNGAYYIPNKALLFENGKQTTSNIVQVKLPRDAITPSQLPKTGRNYWTWGIIAIILLGSAGTLFYYQRKKLS